MEVRKITRPVTQVVETIVIELTVDEWEKIDVLMLAHGAGSNSTYYNEWSAAEDVAELVRKRLEEMQRKQ